VKICGLKKGANRADEKSGLSAFSGSALRIDRHIDKNKKAAILSDGSLGAGD